MGRGGRFLETAMLATHRAGVRPIALTLVPEGALWRVALVVLGTALLALAARIEIPLPFNPVPVTG